MDESKIQQYVLLAKGARGRGLLDLISKATSEPGLFTFGELLDVPTIADVGDTPHAQSPHMRVRITVGNSACTGSSDLEGVSMHLLLEQRSQQQIHAHNLTHPSTLTVSHPHPS